MFMFEGLTFHGISVEQWSKAYGIAPFSHPCPHCGQVLTTTIPIAAKGVRGLRSPRCGCGAQGSFCCVRYESRLGNESLRKYSS